MYVLNFGGPLDDIFYGEIGFDWINGDYSKLNRAALDKRSEQTGVIFPRDRNEAKTFEALNKIIECQLDLDAGGLSPTERKIVKTDLRAAWVQFGLFYKRRPTA